ncbi:unnamed protein product [Phyllotreta striolata]|uniref:Glycoside hydrolase family 31 n=1 Tax=Phyllotreta striolata TaxID=444603 RepID=A0A9N9XLQ5_PHYSR|nr:unnamed protein product [Phyllotreta striolata]
MIDLVNTDFKFDKMFRNAAIFLWFLGVFQITYSVTDFFAQFTENGLVFQNRYQFKNTTLTGIIGKDFNFFRSNGKPICEYVHNCMLDKNIHLGIDFVKQDGFRVTWTSKNASSKFRDCFYLNSPTMNWFGGPEVYDQTRLEKINLDGNTPYTIRKSNNFAVAERFWLNSLGTYIFVDDAVPLFVDQNSERVCFISKPEDPYINRNRTILQYYIMTFNNSLSAHVDAVKYHLGSQRERPSEKMMFEPIWTTSIKYKKNIDDAKVREFAKTIHSYKWTGQIQIDEQWEDCFGSLVVDKNKFPDIKSTIAYIKSLNHSSVKLWVSPFVNDECKISQEGIEKGYFVKDVNGNTTVSWWESNNAHQIDFTNPKAFSWFSSRLKVLKADTGVDGFRFDAGETDYALKPSEFYSVKDQENVPNILTTQYVDAAAQFGEFVDVRAAWRTQKQAIYTRMVDKDSVWGYNNGLKSLIPTLIQMNMNGYSLVLPSVIGGKGGDHKPTPELLIRWTQANLFMVAMQFGHLPWEYHSDSFDVIKIINDCFSIRRKYHKRFLDALTLNSRNGRPVNSPIWWIDPYNPTAYTYDDEYLLGMYILVAPILTEGAVSRDIYLPTGAWKDGQHGTMYQGPVLIKNYSAPIKVLPYFENII